LAYGVISGLQLSTYPNWESEPLDVEDVISRYLT